MPTKAQVSLEKKGYKITYAMSGNTVFATKGQRFGIWVQRHTGWHTGKTITDGRGLENLLKQIR